MFTTHASKPNETLWAEFWRASRAVETDKAATIVIELIRKGYTYRTRPIYACARSGIWQPLHSVLLPGDIVSLENPRDRDVTVDTGFHREDLALLKRLGAADTPRQDLDLSNEPFFEQFLYSCRDKFTAPDRDLPRSPQRDKLRFSSTTGSGPLQVMMLLSDESKARYTHALLALDATYDNWTMRHETQQIYPELSFQSPATALLKEHGRILRAGEIVPIKDVFGTPPANPAALRTLLSHPMADRIKEAFGIAEPVLEPVGEEDPIPLTDLWPGLGPRLNPDPKTLSVIRCRELVADGTTSEVECMRVNGDIYLVETGDDTRDLRLVSQELRPPFERDGA